MNVRNINNATTSLASHIIRQGGVVLLPFDTVYGFVCDYKNERALQKIYQLKNRPENKTIGLAVSDIKEADLITTISGKSLEFIRDKVPGRYTFILKKNTESIPDLCVRDGTVAIRIPDNAFVLALIESCGGVLAQTSANKSGEGNCFSIDDIKMQFTEGELEEVDLVIDGGSIVSPGPSVIFDLTSETPKEIAR